MLAELLQASCQDMWTDSKGKGVEGIGHFNRLGRRYWTWNQRHSKKDRHDDAWLHLSGSSDLTCKTETQEPKQIMSHLSTGIDMFSERLNITTHICTDSGSQEPMQ